MALILSGKYTSAKQFYLSRWLRIFPPYYLVLLSTIAVCILTGLTAGDYLLLKPYLSHPLSVNGTAGFIGAATTNLTLFFQDWVMFFQQDEGHPLSLPLKFTANTHPLYKYLLVPQSWTIGVEEMFYLLAPITIRLRTRTLLVLIILSTAARFYVYSKLGSQHGTWTYRFFPFESALFFLGIIGYRAYMKYDLAHIIAECRRGPIYFIACASIAVGLYYEEKIVLLGSTLIGFDYATLISYIFWAGAVTVLFAIFRNNKLDRLIGNLSYPVYLTHFVIIQVIALGFARWHIADEYLGKIAGLVTVSVSLAMYFWFMRPLDARRYRIAASFQSARLETSTLQNTGGTR